MLDTALEFIADYEQTIKEQSVYLNTTDWSLMKSRGSRLEEYKLHYQVINSLIARLKYVIEEAGEAASSNKRVKTFLVDTVSEIDNYILRVKNYLKREKWQKYEGDNAAELKASEIEFQDSMLKNLHKVKEEVKAMNVNNDKKDVTLPLWGNPIISLAMRKVAEERYPEIEVALENRKANKI